MAESTHPPNSQMSTAALRQKLKFYVRGILNLQNFRYLSIHTTTHPVQH